MPVLWEQGNGKARPMERTAARKATGGVLEGGEGGEKDHDGQQRHRARPAGTRARQGQGHGLEPAGLAKAKTWTKVNQIGLSIQGWICEEGDNKKRMWPGWPRGFPCPPALLRALASLAQG